MGHRTASQCRYIDIVKVLAILSVFASLQGCLGYVPSRQAYWDDKIKDLCEKEGHVQILEQVVLTKNEVDMLPRVAGMIGLRGTVSASTNDPVYAERDVTHLRERNPRVSREEVSVVRRSDRRLVARWIEYVRVGGDFPSHAHPSSLRCPEPIQRLRELQRLFVITKG